MIHDGDEDIFIELAGLTNRGMPFGYKNDSSAAVASPSSLDNVHLPLRRG